MLERVEVDVALSERRIHGNVVPERLNFDGEPGLGGGLYLHFRNLFRRTGGHAQNYGIVLFLAASRQKDGTRCGDREGADQETSLHCLILPNAICRFTFGA